MEAGHRSSECRAQIVPEKFERERGQQQFGGTDARLRDLNTRQRLRSFQGALAPAIIDRPSHC